MFTAQSLRAFASRVCVCMRVCVCVCVAPHTDKHKKQKQEPGREWGVLDKYVNKYVNKYYVVAVLASLVCYIHT